MIRRKAQQLGHSSKIIAQYTIISSAGRRIAVTELSMKAGVSRSYIYAMESGSRGTRLVSLLKVIQVLNMKIEDVIADGN